MMGEYTGFKGKVTLKETAPFDIINRMLEHRPGEFKWPDHSLFKCFRAPFMLGGSSAYLEDGYPAESHLSGNVFHVSFNIKNYESEIEKFLDWIAPYTDKFTDGYVQTEWDTYPRSVLFDSEKFIISPSLEEDFNSYFVA